MPLRDVKPLSEEQWDFLMKILHENEKKAKQPKTEGVK